MCMKPDDRELRAAWRRLRMVGDFDTSMRNRAVRVAVEAAARALRDRSSLTKRPRDAKLRAANDTGN
ncbi:hypothetical protein [Paraburkholderia sp. NMBU_R16]|uniref:hypothetical protein n=1 Tax=Paraburkholderia sp. NMBU_R16 TaxID=2698676 RepID=UPI0020B8A7DA|nr:hypothetical protein [Paraburkholderia sp. NMBU_R16]